MTPPQAITVNKRGKRSDPRLWIKATKATWFFSISRSITGLKEAIIYEVIRMIYILHYRKPVKRCMQNHWMQIVESWICSETLLDGVMCCCIRCRWVIKTYDCALRNSSIRRGCNLNTSFFIQCYYSLPWFFPCQFKVFLYFFFFFFLFCQRATKKINWTKIKPLHYWIHVCSDRCL